MKRLGILVAFLGSGLIAPAVIACGAPFESNVTVAPAQTIVIAHKQSVETYIFQPRFCGAATDFGLVLPIPDKLSDVPSLVDAAVFTKLDTLSKPTVITTKQCRSGDGVGSKSDGTGGTNGGVSVTASGHVGFLDWTLLKADSEVALTDWLTMNGFPFDSPAVPVFRFYAQKGWYFVAFKINLEALGGVSVCKDLGPVKLSFATPTPVIPSRMGAVGKTSGGSSEYTRYAWRIYGVTSAESQLTFAREDGYNRALDYSGIVRAEDANALAGVAVAGDRITRLNLNFSLVEEVGDVPLALAPGKDHRKTIQNVEYEDCLFGCAFSTRRGSLSIAVLGLLGIVVAVGRRRS